MRSFIRQLRVEFNHMLFFSGVFLVLGGAPLFYSLFYAFPYIHEVPRKVPAAIVDLDYTPLSRQLYQMLEGSENIDITHRVGSFKEAHELFLEREVYTIVVIPRGFNKSVLKGEQANIAAYSDGSYLLYYKQTFNAVQTAAQTLGAGVVLERLQSKGIPYQAALTLRTSVVLDSTALFNPVGGYATYVLPAVFILICHQLVIIGISSIMSYEISGRSDKYTIASVTASPMERLLAKSAAYFTAAVFQLMALMICLYLFKIPFNGSHLDLLLFFVPFILCVVYVGIFTGSFMKVPERTLLYLVPTSIPLLFLSGFSWAPYAMQPWLQVIREVLPSTHAILGFLKIFREGASLYDVSNHLIWLWGLAFIFFILAYLRLRILYKRGEIIL